MEKKIQHTERRGLPGGPNEMFSYTTGVFSTEGFRMDSPDVNNYQNIIPSGSITMKEKDGSPLRKGPIHGVDNLGNEQVMYPGYDYEFPGTEVTETLIAKMGGALLDKTIECGNCGWKWKAADGGSDVMDCHKCGGKGLMKAQKGKETKWLGNTLTPEGWVTSTTKGGNYISFTGNQRSDEWINKQIDTGKFGFDPKTNATFPLKKPVKGLSKEDQFMATKQYHDLRAPEGFTSESQQAQIEKLPEWQQDMLNAENTKRRKRVVYNNMQDAVKNPLFYAPGAIALAPIAAAGLTAVGTAAAPYVSTALATQLPGMATVPGATVGNAITAGFAGHGLTHIGPDTAEMYKNPSWENAFNVAMDVAESLPVLGPATKTIGEGYSSLKNINTSIAPELRQGLKTAGPSFGSSVNKTGIVSNNLNDLTYAKDWAKKYGYKLPENLERIAQSDELTNRTIRGLADRHNTFVRGVSTNWDILGQKNPEIIKYLEGQGFNLTTEEGSKAAAEYMSTHIPMNTGYGRFGLKEGENALYLSNSVPTAEGYTYGNGYIVKAKRPTDFSSGNRQDWLTTNDFDPSFGFKGSPFGEGIVKNDYIKRFPTNVRETLAITGDPNKMTELQVAVKEKEALYNQLAEDSWRKHNNLISDLKYRTDANYRNNIISDDPFVRDAPNFFDKMQLKYLENKKDLTQKYYDVLPLKDIAKGVYGDSDVWKAFGKNLFGELDPFSHYAIKGQEGEKVLETLKSIKVNPEAWENTSRAHINKYTNKLTRRQDGGEKEDTSWTAYLNPANWGTSRYDDKSTFKEAFRAARNEGDSDFLWKGERYSTELKAEPAKTSAKPKGITPELLVRQAYRESAFNPKAVSPAGYKGLGQIGDAVIKDYKKANNIKGNVDPFNMKQNADVQKYSMNELYNSSFINKPGQSEDVRLAKTLASYNWGRGNVMNLLNDLKEEGVDIYNNLDWISKLPKEPRDYINDILLQKNTTFNTDFSKALGNQKNKPIKTLYGFRDGGESKPGPLMQAYNRLPAEKKMGGSVEYMKQQGGENKYSEQNGKVVVTTKKVDTPNGPRYYQAKSPDYNFSRELVDARSRTRVADSIPKANLDPRILESLNKKQFGGQLNSTNITMYKDYIKGNIGNEELAIKNYDKLNRIYYSKAKELGMTTANYIMTYIVGNS